MESSSEYFLFSLSHQIRTPLNGIVGYSQLLSQTKLDTIQAGYIRDMNACSIQLLSLINDILDFSKLTMGKVQIRNESFNLKEMFDEINTVISGKLLEKQIKIKFITDVNVPPSVITDRGKVSQILINLITNAIKFSPILSRILVNCFIEREKLYFSVEDNGIGISKEHQKMLFNPFVQVNESVTKNGSGLGLSICKKLTELLNGEIFVESSLNKGSTFTFSVSMEVETKILTTLLNNRHIFTEKAILLCDPDVDKRIALSEILYDFDIFCDICSSEREISKMIQRKRYDCVLLEVSFGKIQLFRSLREMNENIRIIGLAKTEITNYGFDRICVGIDKVNFLSILYSLFSNENEQIIQLNEKSNNNSVKSPKILIAEDVEYNMEILTKMLETLGYNNISKAFNGKEAIDFLQTSEYDILFLDLKMPVLNGFDVAEFIKNRGLNIKIAVLSASILDKDREKAKELGVLYFVLKPFNLNNIRALMRKLKI